MNAALDFDYEKIVNLRHALHQIPELAFEEVKTKQYLMDFLAKETSLKIVDCGYWFYAVYEAVKQPDADETADGKKKYPVAFRADIDALKIPEEEGQMAEKARGYLSQNPGVSHRCGHDGHSAILAGLALYVNQYGADRDVYFIFQHAEEVGGGAIDCCELIRQKQIAEIYAFHNWSGFPEGTVLLKDGVAHQASKGLTISFTGTSTHASQPEAGKNPAPALAKLSAFVEEAAKKLTYKEKVMATIVYLNSGSKNFGITPAEAEMAVTIRAHNEFDLNLLERYLLEKALELSSEAGLRINFNETDAFPETVNDPLAVMKVQLAAERLGLKTMQLKEPFRSSEDFGYYQRYAYGAMFYVGNGEEYPAIHTTGYDFNDNIIKETIQIFAELI